MNLKKAKVSFYNHRASARRRGINFKFTFESWTFWWAQQLGPKWQKYRGQGRGKYQMGRIGDVGPYTETNVVCLKHEINAADGQRGRIHSAGYKANMSISTRGARNGNVKLNEKQVLEIYNSKKNSTEFTKRYGITRTVIYRIRRKKNWAHLTKDLPPWHGS